MASIPSFIFGGDSKYKTQEELEAAREQVRAMLGDIGQSGLTGWGSAMADLGKAIGARIGQGRVDEGQAELLERQAPFSQTLAELAGGYGGGGGAVDPTETGSVTGGDASGYLRYANQGATRNQPLSPKLEQALGYLGDLGITAEVFSGGQDAEGPNRVGSHRHDLGNAGDVKFFKDGRQLSWKNKEDIPLFQEIVRRGKAAGITGFGAGPGYMGEGSMHIGYGTPAVWGAGGQGANAAGWLREAYSGGGANNQAGGVGADPINDAFSRPPPSSGGGAPYRDAIASIESAGSGDYAAVGRPDPKLGRPLGRYQIMERNIGPWSKKHLGREVSAQEFLASPAIQDAIFDGEFGGYVKRYGREGAAQAWLGGPGAVGKDDREDALGTSVGEYGRRFVANLGGGGGADVLAGSGRGPSLLQARPVPINEAGLRTPGGQEFLGRMTNPAPMGGGQQPAAMVPGMVGPMPVPPLVQTPAQPPIPTPRPAPPAPQQQVPQPFDLSGRRRMTPAMTGIDFAAAPGESMAGTETAPRIAPAPVPPAPAPVPTPTPRPTPPPVAKVDPFTDMILGDKAAQFRPGNVSQPLPPGVAQAGLQAARQALAGPLVGGGGSSTMAGGAGTQFPAVPPAPGTPAAAGFGVQRAGGGGGAFPPAPPAPAQQRGGGGPQDVIGKLMTILASPFASDEQKRMAVSMLNREYDKQDKAAEAAAAAADPLNKLKLEQAQLEVEKLRKGDTPALINAGDGRLYNPATGEWITAPAAAGGGGPFSGDGVEAQALNGMVTSGRISVQQAYDLAAGKVITDPATGAMIFMSGAELVGALPGQPPQVIQPAPQPTTPPAPAPAPAAPAGTPSPPAAQAPAGAPGRVLTEGKPGKLQSEGERRDQALHSVMTPELKIIEDNFDALADPQSEMADQMPGGAYVSTPEYQRAATALRSFIASYLYSVSGAEAKTSEIENNFNILKPRVGESEGSKADKKRRLRTMDEAIRLKGGGAPATAPAGGGNTDYKKIYGLE